MWTNSSNDVPNRSLTARMTDAEVVYDRVEPADDHQVADGLDPGVEPRVGGKHPVEGEVRLTDDRGEHRLLGFADRDEVGTPRRAASMT